MKILTALLLLAAFRPSSSQEERLPLNPVDDGTSLLESVDHQEEEEEEEIQGTAVQRLAYSLSDFGYNLYRQVASSNPDANVYLSPLSVATTLSALSLGTVSRNEQILHGVLNYDLVKDLNVHSVYKELLTEITALPKSFKTISRLYTKKLRMRSNFLKQVDTFYGARPKAVFGNEQQDLQNINQWAKSRSGGQINQVINSMPQDLSILLLSAAQYKGQLLTKFNAAETTQKAFNVDHGQFVNIPMMSGTNYPLRYGYDTELSCKIGLFRYVGDISLLIFLPDDIRRNMSLIEDSLNPVFIHDLVYQMQNVQATVSLPKLKITLHQELKESLGEMNLTPLYTPSKLNKISNVPLMVSSIKHSASLELGEKGVQASPAMQPGHIIMDFQVNRPFLLVLYDNPSGSLLHIGRVLDPRGLLGEPLHQ
ncbi:pigment epithelium-derived factor isoform X2 [Scyliorhinus torazame]|uniref:pigment epithelium-derived factor isoform X2 n=1 Tax=Scyliorhinus torazame TaxID=75743 RepID=UPI003B59571F